jgi:hypothetical protein
MLSFLFRTEYCARGSLYDLLKAARQNAALAKALDWPKRINMALDAAKVCFDTIWSMISTCSPI